jgi:Fe-S oxidoreductase/thioredoxin reductase
MSVVKRKQRVAIVGGGLCGLTAAADLTRKRYTVAVYESGSVLGGRIRSYAENVLPRNILENDINSLLKQGIELHLNAPVSARMEGGQITLDQLRRENDAVFIATGASGSFDAAVAGLGSIDATTRATAVNGVFASLEVVGNANEMSSILAMSEGRIAATSIDRFIQRVSLTASRSNEGPYESCLYTNTQGIARSVVTAKKNASYTKEEAILEAGRCIQCECMECVKACEYLKSYGDYPKKYARSIYNNLSIVMGTRGANKLINSCSLCGQCAEICPNDFDMSLLCKSARETMVKQGHMPPSAHDFALRDMQFSNSEAFALTRPQPGKTESQYVFFPGCQLSASAPEQVEQVYAYLCAKLPSVGLMLRCCGAMANWAGQKELFKQALDEFKVEYQKLGTPTVILACSSCYQVFQENLPEIKIKSLWQVMDEKGLPEGITKRNTTLAIHDPCSTRYESAIQDSVRHLASQLGVKVEELPLNREKTSCCSYGGDMWLSNREISNKVINKRISESKNDYLTYCAMCRDFFANHGKPSLHLLDIIFSSELSTRATRRGPGYSDRHENRARLKRKLLKDLWSETMPDEKSYASIHLTFSDEVERQLEDRLILVEDIQQVIEYAQKTGKRFKQPQSGHLLAHFKPTRVTYWVEYLPKGEGYEVFKAYSHRMELGEETKA